MDVTDLKKAEQALKEADRRKDLFLAMLAHELRNPLSSITNALALLRMPDLMRKTVTGPARWPIANFRPIVRLVDDLLDVSRISSGKLQFKMELLDAATVVGRVVETLRNATLGAEARADHRSRSWPATPLGRRNPARADPHQSTGERGQVHR